MNNNDETQNQQNPNEKDSSKLTIEVHRFQNLLEILKDRKKVFTLAFAIATIGTLLFCGITLIVLSIKRLYPYNDITTNAMGTTTLRSENKDVSYFLLSSSELWANSGIRVKKGQTITIKSSGKKHSAIHHLVKNASENNPKIEDPWVGSEGFPEDFDTRAPRDAERARYRIFPKTNQDILLLQIVPDGDTPMDRPNCLVFDPHDNRFKRERNNKFIVVGNRMDDIHIETDGVLYFAINDIVLDEETIIKMMLECDDQHLDYPTINDKVIDLANAAVELRPKYAELTNQHKQKAKRLGEFKMEKDTTTSANMIKQLEDSVKLYEASIKTIEHELESNYDSFLDKLQIHNNWKFKRKETFGKFEFGTGYGLDSNYIELYGYFMNNYRNAWYEDNVGSFLIVVEKVNE